MEEKFMKLAIKEAIKAGSELEVPIGAVIVKDGIVIAKAHNERNKSRIATHHAELLAIEKACKKTGDWRLEGAEMYVTLEPCPMCAGAILNARIEKVFFGAFEKNSENQNLTAEILNDKRLNHSTEIIGGIMEDECSKILSDFFRSKREN